MPRAKRPPQVVGRDLSQIHRHQLCSKSYKYKTSLQLNLLSGGNAYIVLLMRCNNCRDSLLLTVNLMIIGITDNKYNRTTRLYPTLMKMFEKCKINYQIHVFLRLPQVYIKITTSRIRHV